jgi:hypothetical protein
VADERLRLLREAVEYLTLDADAQVRLLEVSRLAVDELGLMFDDQYLAIPHMRASGLALSDAAVDALGRVNGLLDSMSGQRNAEVWTESGLRTDAQWAKVREAATVALDLLPTP